MKKYIVVMSGGSGIKRKIRVRSTGVFGAIHVGMTSYPHLDIISARPVIG